ncbi:hypothetical protein [Enterococcus faecium]|uniref:hypothetical protein n=1 Tax=Enterococcus faecium TaxID=1352 RepID=UPI000BF17C34|nr:hypothetical protein [Enterococcus faecium]PEH49619.1 hypothetical protein CRM75_01160 [Enterococcus faecium]
MNNVDYFNEQLRKEFDELSVHHKKVYERNKRSLEKLGDQNYLRKFEDEFQESLTFLDNIFRSELMTLPSKLEDQTFKNEREYRAFCIDIIHKLAIPSLCYGVEMAEANLRATANQYIRQIKEKEGSN